MGASDQRVDTVARLTGLLEVTRLVRSEGDLDALLPAVAAAISGGMGFGTVVISLYRPAFNDFRVESVHGSEEGRHGQDVPQGKATRPFEARPRRARGGRASGASRHGNQ